MKIKFLLIFSIIISFSTSLFSQTDTSNIHIPWNWDKLSLTALYQGGRVIPTNIFVSGNNANSVVIDDYRHFSLQLTSQSTGNNLWEQLCNHPRWGVAVSAMSFNDKAEIGIPIGVRGFFSAPFFRANRFSLHYDMGFGITFNWNSFNPYTNKYNVSMGAGQAFMSTAGVHLEYALTDRIDIAGGAGFTHFSNGAIKLPNFGINAVAPKVSLKYNFYERPKFVKHEIPKFKSQNEWVFSTFAGIKNIIYDTVDVNVDIVEKYKGMFFPVFGVSALFNHQISYSSKIGIGMTVNYNESINAQVAVDNGELVDIDGKFINGFQVSIYPSYEICADKISVVLQPAFYILRKTSKNQSPVFHQRIMIKYHITDNVFAGITLRDANVHADFVEWTLGYRISK